MNQDKFLPASFGIYAKVARDILAGEASLPNLPDAALRIRRVMQDPDCDLVQIERIIQTDPGLSSYLLQIANSPLYRGWRRIKDLKQALTLFGLETTRSLCLSHALRALFRPRDQRLKSLLLAYWKRSARRAACCAVLSQAVRGLSPDRALLAGLLQEIGLPLLYVRLDAYPETLDQPAFIRGLAETLCTRISLMLLEHWGLDEELCEVARTRNQWQRDHPGGADLADIALLVNLHELMLNPDPERTLPAINQLPAYAKVAPGPVSPRGTLMLLDQALDLTAIETSLNP
ncbi:HDOD domain-containing protein [Caldichromatium japonicum]|uniref:HDOD domain-containing protein n=1 Tax=Caldichromatium japonicum TaxID=2699430 RepID=A0A6G7VAW0_9GAMM|nr:HDOD domain-containing protein [Caldichromatium japonicum]QIK37015.1 HDOD domain-containing protein [Caldichromatium japonicum]